VDSAVQISTATHPYLPAVYPSNSRRPLPVAEEGKDAGLVEKSPARTRIISLPDDRQSQHQTRRQADNYQQHIAVADAASMARTVNASSDSERPSRVVRERKGIDESLSLHAQRAIAAYQGTAGLDNRQEISLVLGVDTYA
jgi:hypothetical protein